MPTMGKSMCHVSKEVLIQVRNVIDEMINNYQEYKHGDWKQVEGVGKFPPDQQDPYPDVSWDLYRKEKWDGKDIY